MVKNHLFHYPRTIKLVNLNKIKFIKIKLPQLSFLFTLSNRFIYRLTSYSVSLYGQRIKVRFKRTVKITENGSMVYQTGRSDIRFSNVNRVVMTAVIPPRIRTNYQIPSIVQKVTSTGVEYLSVLLLNKVNSYSNEHAP